MPLTPMDIHNKEFGRSFRGYNEDEVNEFLDHVIKDYESLLRDKKNLEDQVAQLKESLKRFETIEDSLSKSILIAQETAEEVKANARKEAQLIIKESEKNADRIVNEALIRSREISLELENLHKQASVYRVRFRSLIQAQLELLDTNEWDKLSEE